MRLVARRDPLYDPGREVEDAVFDHFARLVVEQPLTPTADLFQTLRLKVAQASRTNPLLAQALAKAANVNENMDLVAAARAGALIETLDEIAYGNGRQFREAWIAVTSGSDDALSREGLSVEELQLLGALRARHAELRRGFEDRRLTLPDVRKELVRGYTERGKRELEERCFPRRP
jgi:hypothetical protein